MAIHWQVQFKSLRAGTDYTVNVYDDNYSGNPIELKGAAEPFVTDEDDDDDFFKPVRTQSGYLRIVDDGYAADGVTPFDWMDMIPSGDFNRRVTLTNGSGVTVWQGFMQAQDFGFDMCEISQERDFPVHCVLSALGGVNVSPTAYNGTASFAAVLDYAFGAIPSAEISSIVIHGGPDARTWLMTKFDWAVFGKENDEGHLESTCDVLEAITQVCKYWGWSARIKGTSVYMLSPDWTTFSVALVLTLSELHNLASGISGGTISSGIYSNIDVGNAFASKNNKDRFLRGYNKVEVVGKLKEADEDVFKIYPDCISKWMYESGFDADAELSNIYHSRNAASFNTDTMDGSGFSGSLCLFMESGDVKAVVRQMIYSTGGSTVRLRSLRKHVFLDGYFEISGDSPYSVVAQLSVNDGSEAIGHAYYWNGSSWVGSSSTEFTIADFKKSVKIPTDGLPLKEGIVSLRLLGSHDTSSLFDIKDLSVIFNFAKDIKRYNGRESENVYKASNGNFVKNEWSTEVIFLTENYNTWGAGVVYNADLSIFPGWDYTRHSVGNTAPEQRLVDRVAAFWIHSRRSVDAEIRLDLVSSVEPVNTLTIDGSLLYPVSISHNWRDDVLRVKAIEI